MEQTLAEKSYRYIRRKLSRGEWELGARLVNRSLASEIGVSVIPVREAIHRLASEGLVEHIPGAGAFVRNPDRQELDNLYVLRDALESCTAGESARYITEDQLEELDSILAKMQQIVVQIRQQEKQEATTALMHAWLDNEEQFHETLVEASRNRLLTKVINEYRAISQIFGAVRDDPELLTVEVAETTCQDREELLQALRGRDAKRARILMSEQIQKGRKTVLSYFNSRRQALES